MEEEKINVGLRPKFARVAWFNRDNKEHNYGTWQCDGDDNSGRV